MSTVNATENRYVRPAFFIIIGFSDIPYVNYYYPFLFICYAAGIMGNLFLMSIIIIDRSLHTPKYMAVFNLAVADMGDSTTLIPSLIETFLYTTQKVSYEACLVQMFCDLLFFPMQSLTLTVLAYDRFVAICFPLRYHSIVTNTSVGALFAVLWFVDLVIVAVMISFMSRLSCSSNIVSGYYCEAGVLQCNDSIFGRYANTLSIISMAIFYFAPIILISLSYASILLALFKIATWEERIKALKTCSSHFILVSVFYIPLVSLDVANFFVPIERNARSIGSTMSCYVPPVLNPIVYSLNTAEIREFIKKMFKRKRFKTVIPAVSK